MHLVWRRKKGNSMGVRPRRTDDMFAEGMMGYSERFGFCCKTNNKKKSGAVSQLPQQGKSVSSKS